MEQGSTSLSTCNSDGYRNYTIQPKHKVFLSHSGAQKGFVEQLCLDLERCDCYPFFDKCRDCLPIGKEFPRLIFEAIEQCEVGVVVLSKEFFTSKWPMLELVTMANVKKRRPSFTIMPILLGLTFSECRDVANHKQWLSLWHSWAESDSRIDVKDWENALQLLGPTNALKYSFELGEVTFRAEIVEAICKLVPPRTQCEDSHVQGRSRLCKVIRDTIQHSRVSSSYGVHVVGLYGFGGIGKTTICKAMCNDVSEECQGKVAHMELGSRSEEELLKDVLRRLTNMNLEHLGAMNVDEYRYHVMRDMMNIKVFLAIDNVSSATSKQALTLLRANYGVGSVLLVTARSLSELTSLGIDARECMEMPELEMEEARSLFLSHVSCVLPACWSSKDDYELIFSCVEQCHFKKGDGISSHYHPLALQTLGEQLRCIGYVPERWRLLLDEIDFLNPFGEPQHPVFSILRRSFDALNSQDQLLFMDVALFAPCSTRGYPFRWNIFEWLGMVHGVPVQSVMERLETLKRKSLLENFGDGFGRIGMHDLWREFARLETAVGERNALEEANMTNGDRWVNLRRMDFCDEGFMKVEDVKFDCFPSVTVLRLSSSLPTTLELDLRGLKHLRSLELTFNEFWRSQSLISFVGLGSLSNLGCLRCLGYPVHSRCVGEIVHLTNLRVLELSACRRFPDLSRLILLQVVCFHGNDSALTIFGLSPKHTSLQILELTRCSRLRSCPGVGELVALLELRLNGCSKLKEVPNLQKLKRLRKLDVSQCLLLTGLPGLSDLVSLLELRVHGCGNLVELPDMCNLRNLRILDLSYCERIKSLRGLHGLVCLRTLRAWGCKNLTQLPNMHKLTNLKTLRLDPDAPLQASAGLNDLILLQILHVAIDELHNGPDLCKLTKLKVLHMSGWQGGGFSSLAELVSLESVSIDNCKGVQVLPNLERLSKLQVLKFQSCEFEDLFGLINLTSLEVLKILHCGKVDALPDLQKLGKLKELRVKRCARLRDVRGILGLQNLGFLQLSGNPWLHENLGLDLHRLTSLHTLDLSDCGFVHLEGSFPTCSQLRTLDCSGCPIQELPDLTNFPNIRSLYVRDCKNLTKLICTGPLSPKFEHVDISGCMKLQAIPDLTNSQNMRRLSTYNSGVVLSAEHIQDMKAHWHFIDLVTQDTQGSSQGILCCSLGMVTSLLCGCIGASSGGTHPS